MGQVEFKRYNVPARKDLIDFIEELTGQKICEEIGKEPKRWLEELNIVNQMLNRETLCAMGGICDPPLDKPACVRLGDKVFRYTGPEIQLRGIWIAGEEADLDGKMQALWDRHHIGDVATLMVHPDFADSHQQFLPENFEPRSRLVKSDYRPIRVFDAACNGNTATVYAKGFTVFPSFYYESSRPTYRLTSIAGFNKVTSQKEMEIFDRLAEHNVPVPRILGTYRASVEEYLFLEGLEGKEIPHVPRSSLNEIIVQDARMLATLCRLGYHKQGFTDFDDKLVVGNKLYLIDANEVVDIYGPWNMNFRDAFLDPSDDKSVQSLRKEQRELFIKHAQDAIYEYREAFLPTKRLQMQYLDEFCKCLGWNLSLSEKKQLLAFGKGYQRLESFIGMMTEN